MGYYSSLIGRRFRDLVGVRFDDIRHEYRDFLLSEEELESHRITHVLIPLDESVHEIPDTIIHLLSVYPDLSFRVIFVVDTSHGSLIEDTLGIEHADVFLEKRRLLGRDLLSVWANKLKEIGYPVETLLLEGEVLDVILTQSAESDLLVLSRGFGSPVRINNGISPVASYLTRECSCSVLLH